MTGLEVVVGFLIAWVIRKARHVGERLDGMADEALDVGLDRLHEVVASKLGTDPSLKTLEDEAAVDEEVAPRTRRRVELALEDAVEKDPDFAVALRSAVADVQAAEARPSSDPPTSTSVVVGAVTGNQVGTMFGVVTGGSISIDQSHRKQDTCSCGLVANAICPRCGCGACYEHFVRGGTQGNRFEDGGSTCTTCNNDEADRQRTEAAVAIASWMANPESLTVRLIQYFSWWSHLIPDEVITPMLAGAYRLFKPNKEMVRISLSATRIKPTWMQKRQRLYPPPWDIQIKSTNRQGVIDISHVYLALASGGQVLQHVGRQDPLVQGEQALVDMGTEPRIEWTRPLHDNWDHPFKSEDCKVANGTAVRPTTVKAVVTSKRLKALLTALGQGEPR